MERHAQKREKGGVGPACGCEFPILPVDHPPSPKFFQTQNLKTQLNQSSRKLVLPARIITKRNDWNSSRCSAAWLVAPCAVPEMKKGHPCEQPFIIKISNS